MKRLFTIMMAAAVAFSSCSKDVIESEIKPDKSGNHSMVEEFSAHMEKDVTKSELTGNNVVWSPNDYVMVYSGNNTGISYAVKKGTDGTETATLVPTTNKYTPTTEFEIDDNVAFYPSHFARGLNKTASGYSIDVEIEAGLGEQNYGYIPMVSLTDGVEDTDLYFKNVFGLLEIPIISEGGMIYAVTVKANNGEKISGKGTVTFSKDQDPVISFDDSDSSDEVSVMLSGTGSGLALSSTPTSVFVPLPPMTYTNGITVTFYGMLGSEFGSVTKKSSAELVINRSKVRSMKELDFGPTPTVLLYQTTDGNILEPTRLEAKDKDGNVLSYTNVYEYEPWVYGEDLGMIKFAGVAEDIDISFEVSGTTLSAFRGSMTPTNLVTGFSMFWNCKNLQYVDFGNMSTAKVKDMYGMFYGCESLNTIKLVSEDVHGKKVSKLNTENAVDMGRMFGMCTSLSGLDLSMFNTSKVKSMSYMFGFSNYLEKLDLSSFNTENVENMYGMFAGCESLTEVNLGSFNTEKVSSMSGMFSYCTSLKCLDLSGFNTPSLAFMSDMFSGCSSLETIDFGTGFNTSKVQNFSSLFFGCKSLKSLDLSSFNTESADNFVSMFQECKSLESLDLSSFNTPKLQRFEQMFRGCTFLETLDISGFDFSNLTNEDSSSFAFYGTSSLKSIKVGPKAASMKIGSGTFYMIHDYFGEEDYGVLYYPVGSDFSSWIASGGAAPYDNLYDYQWVGKPYDTSDGNIGDYPGYDDKVNW